MVERETKEVSRVESDLGTFEGFNFRDQSAIFPNHDAEEVVSWNHDAEGEAEFWPAGDHHGVALVFRGRHSVTASELSQLDRILSEVDDDSVETYVRICYLVSSVGVRLEDITRDEIDDLGCHLFVGDGFVDLWREAAHELFELYYPEEYRVWERSHCDGLIFDETRFLDSPVFHTEEFKYGEKRILLVCPG